MLSWLDYWTRISSRLVHDYGYFGVFLVQLLASSSLFVPIPGFFVVMAAGAAMDPFLVTISSALGSSIGEFTGYFVGLGGGRLLTKRVGFNMAHKIYARYGVWTVFIFAATPLPFDIVGILSGILRLHPAMFFMMTLSGKLILSGMLAYGGRQSLRVFEDLLVGKINVFAVVFLLLLAAFIIVPFLYWRYAQNSENSSSHSAKEHVSKKYQEYV
jgi:membrane protein DedA with SNARE-associated domain